MSNMKKIQEAVLTAWEAKVAYDLSGKAIMIAIEEELKAVREDKVTRAAAAAKYFAAQADAAKKLKTLEAAWADPFYKMAEKSHRQDIERSSR
jgi:hypothetical protein